MNKTVRSNVLTHCGLAALCLSLAPLRPALAQPYYPRPVTPISIISPANLAVFYTPVDIPIFAYARDSLTPGAPVRFYAGTNFLGIGQKLHIDTPLKPLPGYLYGRDQFTLVWTNPPAGDYALTAVMTNLLTLHAVTSAPVYISVLASVPPDTNASGVVSIVASDPLAIEGTNCWHWFGVTNMQPAWTNWPAPHPGLLTNCGPKDALFEVRRFGDCSQPLTVTYSTSGTATNGVQYVALPDSVTIPAGQAYTLIPLVPIDDGRPDINRTAILTLTASTNQPPAYTLGVPKSAAALILDSNGIRPFTAMLPGGAFHFYADGPDGAWFRLEYSTDLLAWTPLCTNQVFNGAIDFVDPDAPANPQRFYRALPEADTPAR
ncbi:MAG TPA: hypothetical protein VMU04_17315 [Candidatus Acidoferrum sp.]|nr:hypothetical protein [Candidatus Acidoferrum sp.]